MIDISEYTTTSKQQANFPPAIYIVSTPIGNLEDITLRAINTLKKVNYIACEDTRITKRLLSYYGVNSPKLLIYNDFSNKESRNNIIDLVNKGNSIAIVSDAGTPLISDPGYKLIKDASENNIDIVSIPGASSAISALVASGLPTDNFFFEGFLPPKTSSRKKRLNEIKHINTTLICFESPKRILSSLKDIKLVLGDKNIAICREITKKFEEIRRGSIEKIINESESMVLKGEIVLVIDNHLTEDKKYSEEDILILLKKALRTMSTKDASAYVAEITSKHKKEIYQIALEADTK